MTVYVVATSLDDAQRFGATKWKRQHDADYYLEYMAELDPAGKAKICCCLGHHPTAEARRHHSEGGHADQKQAADLQRRVRF